MNKIKEILKNNKILYTIYNKTFSILLKIIGIFIPIHDNIIIFNSFGGKKYDDSPRVIFEYMITKREYSNYKFYWIFDNPKQFNIPNATLIKNNSFKFFYTSLQAKYWISNSGIERGLKFKKKKTVFINTWHGTAIKHIGIDENNLKIKINTSKPEYLFAQSEYDVRIFSRVFNVKKENIIQCGLPRNDELACKDNNEEILLIKKELNIPLDKKIIMYAPTYREYTRDSNGCYICPPINLKYWEDKLSDKYVILFRAHYEVNNVLRIKESHFIKNVSNYNNLNKLLKITDILISDYSSIMIDYSILERPIFNYVYDYEEYKEKRGLYFDLFEKLPNCCFRDETNLIEAIMKLNESIESKKIKKFKEEFVQSYGNARKYIDKIIIKEDLK